MLGDATIAVNRVSRSGSAYTQSTKTESRTEHRRPLLTPDEVMRIGSSEAIIRTGNRRPMRLPKLFYDKEARTAQASALGPARAVEPVTVAPAQQEIEPPALPGTI
jgi:type IV secretory pathway TraG/TraD family ATPase VirD4